MTPDERMARAFRAKASWDEFFGPMVAQLRDVYSARIVEIANTELNRDSRADKITALSNALKILATLEGGLQELARDGELAKAEKLKAENIEKMTAPKRRLLGIAPH